MLLKAYQNQWEDDFVRLSNVLRKALAIDRVRIEHVGSTSVKGLAAKPIIDIDIIYDDIEAFDAIQKGLGKIDYYHNGDQGIKGREAFKRKQVLSPHPVLDEIVHHLYVCHKDSEALHNHLTFRDYLRKHSHAREEYSKLKQEIAEIAGQDKKVYAKLKETMASDFILKSIREGTKL